MGRLGVQIDYLRSVRSQPLYYAGYSHTDDQGREISYDVAREDHHIEEVLGVAIKWPFPRLGRNSLPADRRCVAARHDSRVRRGVAG